MLHCDMLGLCTAIHVSGLVPLGRAPISSEIIHYSASSLQILRAVLGQVSSEHVLGTGRYGTDDLEQAPGWLAEIDAFAGEVFWCALTLMQL